MCAYFSTCKFKCVSFDILKLKIPNLKPIHHLTQQSSVLFLVHIATAPKIIAGKFPIPGNVACIVFINSFNCTHWNISHSTLSKVLIKRKLWKVPRNYCCVSFVCFLLTFYFASVVCTLVLIQCISWSEDSFTDGTWNWYSLQVICLNMVPYTSPTTLFSAYFANDSCLPSGCSICLFSS